MGQKIPSSLDLLKTNGESLVILKQNIRYHCTGAEYWNYTNNYLLPYALEKTQSDSKWGLRGTILPPSSKKQSRSILILGNSHTRQMYQALLCQYSDQVLSSRRLELDGDSSTTEDDSINSDAITVYQMKHNLTIYTAASLPFIYSQRWKEGLEEHVLLGNHSQSLDTLDAIVLGHQNIYERQYKRKQFWKDIRAQAKSMPHLNIKPEKYPEGFTLPELAAVYAGPIVYISMTSPLNDPRYNVVQEYIHRDSNRTNLLALHGRRHTNAITTECSAPNNKSFVSTCITDPKSFNYLNGHRCVGSQGGEPDLLSWDVLEGLHQLLSS